MGLAGLGTDKKASRTPGCERRNLGNWRGKGNPLNLISFSCSCSGRFPGLIRRRSRLGPVDTTRIVDMDSSSVRMDNWSVAMEHRCVVYDTWTPTWASERVISLSRMSGRQLAPSAGTARWVRGTDKHCTEVRGGVQRFRETTGDRGAIRVQLNDSALISFDMWETLMRLVGTPLEIRLVHLVWGN